MLNLILAADNTKDTSWVMWVIIGVVLVLMIVLTVLPQKKRQKEQQKMMDSLAVGTKLMTVGGLVGKITQVNSDNTLIVNVGTETTPTLIVIDRKAVGYILEAVAAPVVAPVEAAPEAVAPVEEAPVVEELAVTAEEPAEEQATIELVEEDAAPEEDSVIADLNDPFGK